MNLLDTITADMKTAMKERNQTTLNVIRALKAALKNAAIEKGGADATLEDSEALSIIRKQIKQRQDSLTQFQENNRPELAETEQKEIDILEKYLPTPLSDEEINTLVTQAIQQSGATTRADMGKVMGLLQKTTQGRADGKTLSQAVITALSA